MEATKKLPSHGSSLGKYDNPILALAEQHIKTQHGDSDGWIAICRKRDGDWKQSYFKPDQVRAALQECGNDVYYSQNTFYTRRRRVEDIRQLRALYVDLDCYNFNFVPEWVVGKMEFEMFGQTIPEPNQIIYSGRGLNLIWHIEPVPIKALPLWQAVEHYLFNQLKKLGGDSMATDAARVFRIPGSVNSKNGEMVHVQYRHSHRYTLKQIQNDYLPELKKKSKNSTGQKSKIIRLFNLYTLHKDRLDDLKKLIRLRDYDCEGHREKICFLYRYWNCCFIMNEADALEATLSLNSEFKYPLSDREVITATRSAEKASRDKKYKLTNGRIIEWLNITEDEQRYMRTIIGKDEKRRRNTKAKREKRRAEGMMDRSTYLAKATERRSEALRMREEGMTQKEIASALNIKIDTVKSYFRKV